MTGRSPQSEGGVRGLQDRWGTKYPVVAGLRLLNYDLEIRAVMMTCTTNATEFLNGGTAGQ
jgi:hypothetical protein